MTIHPGNMQVLATEMFKVKNNIAAEIMKDLFAPKISPYDLRNTNSFKTRRVNSSWHGTESVSYLGPRICDLVPNEIKNLNLSNLSNLKSKDGSLKDVHAENVKYILGEWVYNSIKYIGFQ